MPTEPTRFFPVPAGDQAADFTLTDALARTGGEVPSPVIGMIWAQTADGVIGAGGGMPWHLPEDLAHFKAVTEGHPVIMGRRTWESFPEQYRPLPGRTNIVVSSSPALGEELDGQAVVVDSVDKALDTAWQSPGGEEIWLIGGAALFEETAALAHVAVVTVIDTTAEGDTFAPRLGPDWTFVGVNPASGWQISANGLNYRFALWTRAGQDASE